ncbi:tol2 transposase [Labeo rohita]|uniref:Tol2 transposase n=1 Tax=Labeo rohita TaxID=84645 RepID=A0A498LB01_LABRO|nr:tol2 transposase [Labeo rohita]RXN33957.1 tol2 transposase [Labeo rohita]
MSHECIVATVTDNRSNFVKAFKEFSITIEEQDEEDGNEDLSFVHIDSLVPEYPSLSRLNNATMGKCSALWNASGRPKSAEKLSEVLNCRLITPCPTRWNSLYDSVNQLNSQRGKLGDIMLKLNLPSFRDAELDYLEEYTKILKPIAVAIDRLQGQSSCYYAELLPTLFAVESKLEALRSSNFRYCSHLLQAIMDGFRSRFSSFLQLKPEVNEAILASVTHPYFKMRWLPQQLSGGKKRVHELMIQSAADLGLVMESGSSSTTADGEVEDFFVFTEDVEVSGKSTHSKAELETLQFLEDQSLGPVSIY